MTKFNLRNAIIWNIFCTFKNGFIIIWYFPGMFCYFIIIHDLLTYKPDWRWLFNRIISCERKQYCHYVHNILFWILANIYQFTDDHLLLSLGSEFNTCMNGWIFFLREATTDFSSRTQLCCLNFDLERLAQSN